MRRGVLITVLAVVAFAVIVIARLPALSMEAVSTRIPFCCERRASQGISVSKGAFCKRTLKPPGPAGSLPASELASPDSRAELSTRTSSDCPFAPM